MKRKIICIACPSGCHLEVEAAPGAAPVVSGNKCPKGASYGVEEATAPKRTVTAVVRTDSAEVPFAPVRTDKAILKKHIPSLLRELAKAAAKIPFKTGDVLVRDFEGSGVNVVFSRSVGK